VSHIRNLSPRAGALALAVFFLGAALAVAAPVSKLPKSDVRHGGSSAARTFATFACVSQGIACNTTVNGDLTADDCPLGDGSFYDAWTFQGTPGQSVTITMRASGFDTYLFLLDPNGTVVEENDDINPGSDTNSRVVFSITDSGTYTIQANSYDPNITGPYTLELVCSGGGPGPCTSNSTTLCLNGGRFRVTTIFSAPSLGITNAPAQAVPLTSDTGYFWFFSASNVELVLKAVDGRSFNNYFWVFYGALSDVEYTITVTDTVTGAVKPYHNTAGHLASVADVTAFRPAGASSTMSAAPLETEEARELADRSLREVSSLVSPSSASESTACAADGSTLCLNAGRFQVRVIFSAPSLGITNAPGHAVPLTTDTGYFWFFSASNVELVIKAVDGRTFNGYFWVFYGALSDVEYTITVTDTVTGAIKTYPNTAGHLASVADVTAFH
jgi:Bacterial pre-peptidase C-terminal domain